VASKDAAWLRFPFVIMDAEVEGASTGNPDLLRDVIPATGEGKAMTHEGCSVSEAAGSVRLS
jgi:hypothetical protein